MNINKNQVKLVASGLVAGMSLVLFSGCFDMFKKGSNKDAGADVVLAKIDDKTAVTKKEFYTELSAQMRNMDPSLLPLNMQRKFLDELVRIKLMVAAAKKKGIESNAEFKKAFEEQQAQLRDVLLARYFSKSIFDDIEVTDKEVSDDYDKNQSRYLKEQGGVLVQGLSFSDRAKALSFYEKVRQNPADFEALSKKEKDGKFRNFGRVGADKQANAMVPEAISDAALKLNKLPAVDVVKVEKETWVINVSDKQDAIIFPLDEIKEQLRNQLKVMKYKEISEKRFDDLKNEFKIDVNEDFFKEPTREEPVKEDDSSNNL